MAVVTPGPIESHPLHPWDLPTPHPAQRQVRICIDVCGVCRTDLHIAEGDLPLHCNPIVPGHEAVGTVVRCGQGVQPPKEGDRVGVAWLCAACMYCRYCQRGEENLCAMSRFTGYDGHGGYADYMAALEAFVYPLPSDLSSVEPTPFLYAGIIGYRALRRCGVQPKQRLGLYGLGGSAHIVIPIARYWDCEVYLVTRTEKHRALAKHLGATWVEKAQDPMPEKLHAAIIFSPARTPVPLALAALDRGSSLALAGVCMTQIPALDYEDTLFYERTLCSITANTRQDGRELFSLAQDIPLHTHTEVFPLAQASVAFTRLKDGLANGAAVRQFKGHIHAAK